jgi:hypothetical protein
VSTPVRRPLGEQALYVIHEAAERSAAIDRAVQREALRAKIDQASVRPLPGTSHALTENKPLSTEHHGVDREGKPGKVKVFDLVGAAPVLWCRKGVEKRKVPKGKV